MKKVSIVLICAFALISCRGGGQSKKVEQNETEMSSAKMSAYQFAVSNKDGSKFIVIQNEELEAATSLDELCFAIYGGKIFHTKHIGEQLRNETNDNGRENFENFDNLQGAIFENLDGKILPPNAEKYDAVWDAVLLVNQGFLDENRLIQFTQPEEIEEGSKATIQALEKQFGRKVISSQRVIYYGENSFFSVQFEHKGNQALGIYMTETANGERAYIEFPATFESNKDGYALSVWHVDDDGYFVAPFISAVFMNGDSYVFIVNDRGFEGTQTFFIRQVDNKLVKDEESSYSRYTAPL